MKRNVNHDWRRPWPLVGGLEENPGVVGHRGGVIVTEVCARCGIMRVSTVVPYGADPIVTYRDADTLTWVDPSEGEPECV